MTHTPCSFSETPIIRDITVLGDRGAFCCMLSQEEAAHYTDLGWIVKSPRRRKTYLTTVKPQAFARAQDKAEKTWRRSGPMSYEHVMSVCLNWPSTPTAKTAA